MLKDKPDDIETKWDQVFDHYIKIVKSPGESHTFESTPALIARIVKLADPKEDDTVLDMGAGWGRLTLAIAPLVRKVIAVDPSQKNIEAAKEETKKQGLTNIEFVRGNFLKPNVEEKVNLVVSSIAFHHVIDEEKGKAVKIMYDLLEDNGRVVICDPMFFFDPEENPERFNRIYRYLAPKVTPDSVYKAYFEPYFIKYKDYVYTWDDMKKYTSKNELYYKAGDLIRLFERAGFTIEKTDELAPFFGILCAKEVKDVRR
jgi:ubiquinone/menaquinone biosynthesis C-methylase UbiE